MLVSLFLTYLMGAVYRAVHSTGDHHRGWWSGSGAVRGTVVTDGAAGLLFAGTTDCHIGTYKTKT